ncbi:MAG: capping complex subunit for YIEGIA [Limnochordia bacterium]|jgi:hypothetical protein
MEIGKRILAAITEDPRKVSGGGVPIFHVDSPEEKERIALYMARITEGVIHDIGNGTYILVAH